MPVGRATRNARPTAIRTRGPFAWNRNPERPIPGEEALALYERNWRHVDKDHLTLREAELIHELAEEFGNGCLLAS